jgi:hypothetical protein
MQQIKYTQTGIHLRRVHKIKTQMKGFYVPQGYFLKCKTSNLGWQDKWGPQRYFFMYKTSKLVWQIIVQKIVSWSARQLG